MARRLFLLSLCLGLAGCIEDRLSVDIYTQVYSDGSCTRRIEYALERVDSRRDEHPVDIADGENPLYTRHRFPSGDAWRVEQERREGVYRVIAEATLPSPNDFDGDYFRAPSPAAPPARNFISVYASPDDGIFEYNEVFRDPVSPLAGARALARQLAQRDGDFAPKVLEALDDDPGAPTAEELRRSFRELLVDPLAEDLASLSRRPLYGPRERRALDAAFDRLEDRHAELSAALHSLAPGLSPERLDEAVEDSLDALVEETLEHSDVTVQALGLNGPTTRIHFRATLVMPFPIRRSNTCAVADTAVWEFEGEELYGRGFEMMAMASAP